MVRIPFIVLSYHNKPTIFLDIKISKRSLKKKGLLPFMTTTSAERKKRFPFIMVIHFPLPVYLTFL